MDNYLSVRYSRIDNSKKVIYDVGGKSGEWSRWYRMAGYDVRIIDPLIWPFRRPEDGPDGKAHGVLLTVPCKEFVVSGARWWRSKDPALLEEACKTAKAILDFKDDADPEWWVLENPVGRLPTIFPELGRPTYTFHPWEFGDPWMKKTCIWGTAAEPPRTHFHIPPGLTSNNSRIHMMSPGPYRARMRAITPPGFAKAFFEVNP